MDSLPSKDVLENENNFCDDYEIYFLEFIKELEATKEADIKKLINTLSEKIASEVNLSDFKPSGNENYSRNYLGKHHLGWELLVMCWSKGQVTPIHGHPHICSYNFTQGEFHLEIFELDDNSEPVLKDSLEISEKTIFTDIGLKDTFANHIHRIECRSEIGYSIHVYSDDAQKGTKF